MRASQRQTLPAPEPHEPRWSAHLPAEPWHLPELPVSIQCQLPPRLLRCRRGLCPGPRRGQGLPAPWTGLCVCRSGATRATDDGPPEAGSPGGEALPITLPVGAPALPFQWPPTAGGERPAQVLAPAQPVQRAEATLPRQAGGGSGEERARLGVPPRPESKISRTGELRDHSLLKNVLPVDRICGLRRRYD